MKLNFPDGFFGVHGYNHVHDSVWSISVFGIFFSAVVGLTSAIHFPHLASLVASGICLISFVVLFCGNRSRRQVFYVPILVLSSSVLFIVCFLFSFLIVGLLAVQFDVFRYLEIPNTEYLTLRPDDMEMDDFQLLRRQVLVLSWVVLLLVCFIPLYLFYRMNRTIQRGRLYLKHVSNPSIPQVVTVSVRTPSSNVQPCAPPCE